MNNEQGMLHYTLLFIIFIYHPEWGEDSAKDVYIYRNARARGIVFLFNASRASPTPKRGEAGA